MKFSTKAIHVGQTPDPLTGAIIRPVYLTSTYAQEELGKNKGFVYARGQNPTRQSLEECLAALEGGEFGLCFASGVAASACVMNLLGAGDHVIVSNDIYGGTYRLFTKVLARYDLAFSFFDTTKPSSLSSLIKPNTKLIWLETPTNPLLHLVDLKETFALIDQLDNSRSIIKVVDNTFATPYFQTPLAFGADIVVHSTTKYLGGHSDVLGGCLITSQPHYYEVLKFHQNAVGAIPSPFDCWLVLRGIKTLALRMQAHAQNALQIAQFLQKHPALEKVIYPGLSSHPQYELACRQMTGASGMITCIVKGGLPKAQIFLQNTKLFSLAESLGGVESLICHPSTMTHASIPAQEREAHGIVDGLVRLSVGIEGIEDLIEDLANALSKLNE